MIKHEKLFLHVCSDSTDKRQKKAIRANKANEEAESSIKFQNCPPKKPQVFCFIYSNENNMEKSIILCWALQIISPSVRNLLLFFLQNMALNYCECFMPDLF